MSAGSAVLPPGFEVLEPFVAAWAISGAAERADRRGSSSAAERASFYKAAMDVLPAALEYLDRKPIDGFDASEERLMNLLLNLCHVALAVEAQGDDEPKHATYRPRLKITRAS